MKNLPLDGPSWAALAVREGAVGGATVASTAG